MEKIIYSTKDLNPDFYMVLGVDDNYPVLYVFKDDELFDWHISVASSFRAEMQNTISCYITVHNDEPSIEDILTWRQWYKYIFNTK